MKTDPAKYPKRGTQLAKTLECLAAEPCGPTEIAHYLGRDYIQYAQANLNELKKRGLVERIGKGKWALTDPETEALVYSEE